MQFKENPLELGKFVAELKEKDSSLMLDDSLLIQIINTRNTNPRRFMQPQNPLELVKKVYAEIGPILLVLTDSVAA